VPKHAIALGYFFLAVLCVALGQNGPTKLNLILTSTSVLACFIGGVFFVAASVTQLQAGKECLAKWIRLAQQPPDPEDPDAQ